MTQIYPMLDLIARTIFRGLENKYNFRPKAGKSWF